MPVQNPEWVNALAHRFATDTPTNAVYALHLLALHLGLVDGDEPATLNACNRAYIWLVSNGFDV